MIEIGLRDDSTTVERTNVYFRRKKLILLSVPLVLLASTSLAFLGFVSIFGNRGGYFAGFLFYWLGWCLLFPAWLIGWRGVARLFRDGRPRFGRPTWLGLTLLALPLLLGFGFAFPQALPRATLAIIIASAAIALVNATAEEILWRGVYVTVFPQHLVLGYLYPAVGFAIWHVAPQLIFPSKYPGGAILLVVFALVVGLMWGWVARQSGSIRWTTVSHVLFNFSGLGALVYLATAAT
jgi:membrane protease YdiL (CAAX protease family)